MKKQKALTLFLGFAVLLLISAGVLSAWVSRSVLDPARLATVTSSGRSLFTTPRPYFKTGSLTGTVGQPVAVAVMIDPNGGSLASIGTDLAYDPIRATVTLDVTAPSICQQYTEKTVDSVSGHYIVRCTAPSSGVTQVAPFATFLVTPRTSGTISLRLKGKSGDYSVITVP